MASKHTQAARGGAARETRTRQGLEYRALLDAAVDAIIVIDHLGVIQEFSQAAQRVFGYTADEVIGSNVNVLMPEPYHSEHDGYLARYAGSRDPHIIGIGREVRAKRKDGSLFPCDLAVGQVQGVEPPRFIGFIRDITARKEAEEQLRRSEAELRLAQELANLGNYVMHVGDDSRDYFSPQLHRILGVRPGDERVARTEFLGRWVHASDRKRVSAEFARMDAGKAALDIEYQVVLRDGRTRHLHHIAQAVRDQDGRVLKHVGTIHDITDRRHAEDEARQLQERLTHFSRLSTMGEMAAGLAHEINQPLSAIATYAQACQRFLKQPESDIASIALRTRLSTTCCSWIGSAYTVGSGSWQSRRRRMLCRRASVSASVRRSSSRRAQLTGSRFTSRFFTKLRRRRITSPARSAWALICSSAATTSAISGSGCFRKRWQAWA